MRDIRIRTATVEDAAELLKIYEYYVIHTAITFEYAVPTLDEFKTRIANTLRKYPYLVATCGDKIVGYAYAGAFVGRAAYDWSVETTIYIAADERRRGAGRILYDALEEILINMGVTNLYACIGYPEVEDEYLTRNSADFHAHVGFVRVGEFHKCGYKFQRWYNMLWMEKIIGKHVSGQEKIRSFPELRAV